MPIPVPVHIHKEHHHKSDHWGSSSNLNEDNWTSASSNDEIKPYKQMKVSSSSVPPNRPLNVHNHMMNRMENTKSMEQQKSTLLSTLLNTNEKQNRSDKKSDKKTIDSSKKKSSTSLENNKKDKDLLSSQNISPQLISHHHLIDPINQEILPAPAFGLLQPPDSMPANAMMNPSFLPPMNALNEMHQQHLQNQQHLFNQQQQQPTLEQQQQLHDAIQHHIQMQQQQQFEQHLQNEHARMQEAMSSSMPHQLPNDSPLISQLPIPLPGQIISAPVYEPINSTSIAYQNMSANTSATNNLNQQQMPQFNELVQIIPYELQQQLQAVQHLRQMTNDAAHHSLKELASNRENSIINYENNKEMKEQHAHQNKKYHQDHLMKGNYFTNLLRTITLKPNCFKFICILILLFILKSIIFII